jgi:hypothetical protein
MRIPPAAVRKREQHSLCAFNVTVHTSKWKWWSEGMEMHLACACDESCPTCSIVLVMQSVRPLCVQQFYWGAAWCRKQTSSHVPIWTTHFAVASNLIVQQEWHFYAFCCWLYGRQATRSVAGDTCVAPGRNTRPHGTSVSSDQIGT